ncbi:MAG: hypothetical protein LBI15_02535 [Dysgonamonadaceae bacterium]|jgi:hypothetical protein|nr:hypothetical protein [Dysgonamonadaceae bacterium]
MKLKNLLSKIEKYFREVSVVIIGISITLLAGHWITNRNAHRNMELSMNAIKIELERNAISFEDYARRLHRITRYSQYVSSVADSRLLNIDSVRYYSINSPDGGIGWGNLVREVVFTKNAFEMFKSLGYMRHMTDRQQLETLWEIYNDMENMQRHFDHAIALYNELLIYELQLIAEGKGTHGGSNTMFFFFNLGAPPAMEKGAKMMAERIRDVLLQLKERN